MFGRQFLMAVLGLGLLATPAFAQDSGPFGGFKHDRTKPIEITADSLEVRQAESLAIFEGKVVAGQDTLRLTADRVEVTYDENQGDSETGAIKNMKANGNVFLSNGAETAQGARAEYDVDTGMVQMSGAVVLTQGENAIKGEQLTINLNTGQAKMQSRVSAIFTPKQSDGGQTQARPVCTPEQKAAAEAAGILCVPAPGTN